MPTLIWGGKEKVVNHHHDVPLRTLRHKYAFNAPEGTPANSSGNMIIHGDNLEALKALLPEYERRIKCIYIDPPYNTGNEGWIYDDNVNDPKIRKWLGQVVGKEGEDLSRHDKWLCMMYPRLKLLHRLLAEDGTIFVSIDDNEVHTLRYILDEIFGAHNFVGTIIWEKSDSPRMDAQFFSNRHDFIVVYARKMTAAEFKKLGDMNEEPPKHYDKTDEQGRRYYLKPLRAMGGQGDSRSARPTLYFPLMAPDGTEVFPKKQDGSDGAWRWRKEKIEKELARIDWVKGRKGWTPYFRIYAETSAKRPAETVWFHTEVGSNRTSKIELKNVFPESDAFATPKPTGLIKRILQIATNRNDLILDSFAGSGTTAHAVLKLNQQDGGNRKFILIEMMDYAETITAERVRRVMSGYGENSNAVAGIGGHFDFYEMGEAIFTEDGGLNPNLSVDDLRRYIAFTENIPLALQLGTDNPRSPYLLGIVDDMAYFFFYEPEKTTTLDLEFLGALSFKPASLIVYADNCLLDSAFLQRHNIIFKKIPRDVMRY